MSSERYPEKPASTRSRDRAQAFRLRMGREFQDAELARDAEHLKIGLYEKWLAEKYAVEAAQKRKVAVPATTRGIGLNSVTFYHYATTINHKIARIPGALSSLYRISLLQASKTSFYANRHALGLHVNSSPSSYVGDPDWKQEFSDLTPFTGSLIATSLSCFGALEYGSTIYCPQVPPFQLIGPGDPTYALYSKTRSGRITKRENFDPDDVDVAEGVNVHYYQKVNPFTVTYERLPVVSACLSDATYPNVVRAYFRRHCPIPGVIWNDANVVTNPEVIWRENQSASDSVAVASMMKLVKRKDTDMCIQHNFAASGGSHILCTVEPTGALEGNLFSDAHKWKVRSQYQLYPEDDGRALIGLCTEIPNPDEIDELEHWYFRLPEMSIYEYTSARSSLVGTILTDLTK